MLAAVATQELQGGGKFLLLYCLPCKGKGGWVKNVYPPQTLKLLILPSLKLVKIFHRNSKVEVS